MILKLAVVLPTVSVFSAFWNQVCHYLFIKGESTLCFKYCPQYTWEFTWIEHMSFMGVF